MRKRIAIVGAGLMGRLCALALSEAALSGPALQIHLLEQGDFAPPETAFTSCAAEVAAAMLSPLAESVQLSRELQQLAYRSMTLWQAIALQIPAINLQQQGTVMLSHPQQRHLLQHLVSKIKATAQYQPTWLDREALAQLEPSLAPRFNHSCYLPGEGQLDNSAFMRSSLQMLSQRGVQLHSNSHCTIAQQRLVCNGNAFEADIIIDCRGLGARNQLPTLRAVRGEVLRVRAPSVTLSRPVRLIHPRYALYIAPKANQLFVVGATELESAEQSGPSVRSALELLSALYAVDPAFAEAEILSLNASARPALNDNAPQLIAQKGLISVNGLYRHGFLLGPALAEQVVQQCLAQLADTCPNTRDLASIHSHSVLGESQ